MEITTRKIFIGLGLGLLLMNGENIKTSLKKGDEIKATQSAHQDRLKLNKQDARESIDLSKVALDRARSCIKVVNSVDKSAILLTEGEIVNDPSTKRAIRPKANVCSATGDTAVTDSTGAITDLARVSDTDMATYKSILKIK